MSCRDQAELMVIDVKHARRQQIVSVYVARVSWTGLKLCLTFFCASLFTKGQVLRSLCIIVVAFILVFISFLPTQTVSGGTVHE